jgi:ATP-binding cassette subfamily B (MDR/TAP) protein 1
LLTFSINPSFSSGQVLEQGTHNKLLASPDGAYAALVSAQKLATMDDSTTLANNSSDDEINDPEKKIFTPEEAEDFAAHEKPKMLTRASTGGASLSSEALKGVKGESERGKTLNYGIIFKRLFDINRSETKYYILGIIMSCCSGMVYVFCLSSSFHASLGR